MGLALGAWVAGCQTPRWEGRRFTLGQLAFEGFWDIQGVSPGRQSDTQVQHKYGEGDFQSGDPHSGINSLELLTEGQSRDKLTRTQGENVWGGVQLQAVRAGLEDAGGEEKEGMCGCPGRRRGFEGMGGSEGAE